MASTFTIKQAGKSDCIFTISGETIYNYYIPASKSDDFMPIVSHCNMVFNSFEMSNNIPDWIEIIDYAHKNPSTGQEDSIIYWYKFICKENNTNNTRNVMLTFTQDKTNKQVFANIMQDKMPVLTENVVKIYDYSLGSPNVTVEFQYAVNIDVDIVVDEFDANGFQINRGGATIAKGNKRVVITMTNNISNNNLRIIDVHPKQDDKYVFMIDNN